MLHMVLTWVKFFFSLLLFLNFELEMCECVLPRDVTDDSSWFVIVRWVPPVTLYRSSAGLSFSFLPFLAEPWDSAFWWIVLPYLKTEVVFDWFLLNFSRPCFLLNKLLFGKLVKLSLPFECSSIFIWGSGSIVFVYIPWSKYCLQNLSWYTLSVRWTIWPLTPTSSVWDARWASTPTKHLFEASLALLTIAFYFSFLCSSASSTLDLILPLVKRLSS